MPITVHQLRNATIVVEGLGKETLLVDPMLGDAGSVPGLVGNPGFKLMGEGKRPNPLVPLPPGADALLDKATAVLVTHSHPDHIDAKAVEWIKGKGLPVYTGGEDVAAFQKRGLDARELVDGALGLRVEVVPAQHGHGAIGWCMGPGVGIYLQPPEATEPSIYITGDTVMTPDVRDIMARLQPDVVVAPAGAANFGLGTAPILFSLDELVELCRTTAPGTDVVFNHMEALDHCPTTRAALTEHLTAEGILPASGSGSSAVRAHIPADGEALTLSRDGAKAPRPAEPPLVKRELKPGVQKWVASLLG